MAWTTTKKSEYATGNHKVQLWTLAADSATLELNTGFGVVDNIAAVPATATGSFPNFAANVLSAGTASNGYIAVTGATSGQVLYVTVWGH